MEANIHTGKILKESPNPYPHRIQNVSWDKKRNTGYCGFLHSGFGVISYADLSLEKVIEIHGASYVNVHVLNDERLAVLHSVGAEI